MKILLAEDNSIDRCLLASAIRSSGHEVIEVSDGAAAWRVLTDENISFVVSDWMMPGLSGPDLCDRVRSAAFDRYVYVILCTARSAESDMLRGMEAGADDYLSKPVSGEELRARIRAGERILQLDRRWTDKNVEHQQSNQRLRMAYDRMESDLKAAAWMQEHLLPPMEASALGVACNWRYRPSSYMAGDMFNFFAIDDRFVGFYLLDVAGHGVPAAMFSVALSMMLTPDAKYGTPLKRLAPNGETFEVVEPAEVVADLNRRFQNRDDKHFTMSYGLLDSQASLLRLAQAGNPNPVLIESGGRVKTLTEGGFPVGLWPEMDFDYVEAPFKPGDRLVLYSDGVTECTNCREEEFGDQRLLRYLSRAASQPLDGILNGLERQLEDWHGSSEFTDDVSLLAVELTRSE